MKMVYIASPLRGDYNTNIKKAVEYCRLAGEQGVLPLAPHIIFSQWCNDTIPEQREQGLQFGLALLEKADELWVMGTEFTQGMQGEVAFALEHKIPMFLVTHPYDPAYYPVSADEKRLLTSFDCIPESSRKNYEGQFVILRHEHLKPEYRIPRNQIWAVTHGPGCRPNYAQSATMPLKLPLDGVQLALGRGVAWGIVTPEALAWVNNAYPEFDTALLPGFVSEGEPCR